MVNIAKSAILIALAGILCGNIFFLHAQQKLPLAGEWHFKLDREDKGIDEQWYRQQLKDPVKLPGSSLRFYDLKRWGLLQQELTNSDKVGKNFYVVKKHDYYPIPQQEIDANGKMEQNPLC